MSCKVDDDDDNGAENLGKDHIDDDCREKTCEFTIPNMTDTWYGFFEKPSMQIVSIRPVSGMKNRWRVKTTARAAYCANFCPSPTLRFYVLFKTQDRKTIAGEIVYNIVENVQTVTTKATVTVNDSEEQQATIENIVKRFSLRKNRFARFATNTAANFARI